MRPLEENNRLGWRQGMSLDELRKQRAFYERGRKGDSRSRKLAEKKIREIDREIDSRQESER